MAVCADVVGLVSAWLMFACPACALPPVMPPVTTGAAHEYVVPAGTPAGATVNVPPLQIVDVCAATAGTGFTVTVTVNVDPAHTPDVGVTV